jgi:hypothetical protein
MLRRITSSVSCPSGDMQTLFFVITIILYGSMQSWMQNSLNWMPWNPPVPLIMFLPPYLGFAQLPLWGLPCSSGYGHLEWGLFCSNTELSFSNWILSLHIICLAGAHLVQICAQKLYYSNTPICFIHVRSVLWCALSHDGCHIFVSLISSLNIYSSTFSSWYQWPCSLRHRPWSLGSWDHRSRFRHGCFSLSILSSSFSCHPIIDAIL